MRNPRQRPTASHLEVHRLATPLPFGELAAAVGRCLAGHPRLGLFPDPAENLIRVGGLGLRGDFLIRRTREGADGELLAASRRGDRAAFASFAKAMGAAWSPSARGPGGDEGLGFLGFLQGDVLFECARHLVIGPRALEDAFSCRFEGLDPLRLRLAELNGEAMSGIGEIEPIICDDPRWRMEAGNCIPAVVLHQGRRIYLDRIERVRAGGRTLCLRASFEGNPRRCLIGRLAEEVD